MKAEELRQQGRVAAALAAARGPIGALPAELLVVRARALWDMEHTEAAAEQAFEAVRRDPTLPAARAMRGLAQLDAGDLGAAWDEAEYAQKRAPEEPLTYLLLSELHGEHGQFEEAAALLSEGVRRRPFDADLRLHRAGWLSQIERGEESLRDVEVVLTRFPEHVLALSVRAALLGASDRADRALDSAGEAVRLAPKCAGALMALGLVHFWRAEDDVARRVLGRAVRTAPASPRIATVRALPELRSDPRAALALLPDGKLCCRPSVHADIRYLQAVCHHCLDAPEESRRLLDSALEYQPWHLESLDLRCWLLLLADEEEGALRDAQAVLARHPDELRARSVRGAVQVRHERWNAALEDSSVALATDPQDVLSLWVHGTACAMTGDTERARAALSRLTAVDATGELTSRLAALVATARPEADRTDWSKRTWEVLHRVGTVVSLAGVLAGVGGSVGGGSSA
ncbi:tetratricopeptide repeat protein [Streptomyces sp. NPDC051954]|uniref:tetratricopeptide repeat protein n=1 Tax=Streptomyces sp. NPDC051954 TaxID=3155524 RepID=UPI003434D035